MMRSLLLALQFGCFSVVFLRIECKVTVEEVNKATFFKEDEKRTFSCHVPDAADGEEVVWTVKDPKTNEKIFYSYEMSSQSHPTKLDKEKKATFSLYMRRDFKGMVLECKRLRRSGDMGNFTFVNIKKTIEIKQVTFMSLKLVHGEPMELACIVEADPKFVKLVDFRGSRGMSQANKQRSLGPNRTEFLLSHQNTRADLWNHDGKLIQCFAARDGFKKPTGNVMSPMTKMVVHYFVSVSWNPTKQTVPKGNMATVMFVLFSNPKPKEDQFSVMKANTREENITVNNVTITKATGNYKYDVRVQFQPKASAEYDIKFKPDHLEKKQKVMSADISIDEPGDGITNEQSYEKNKNSNSKSPILSKLLIIGASFGGILIIAVIIALAVKRNGNFTKERRRKKKELLKKNEEEENC